MVKSSHYSYDILKVNFEVFLILEVSFILEFVLLLRSLEEDRFRRFLPRLQS